MQNPPRVSEDPRLDRDLLKAYHFDAARLDTVAARLRAREVSPDASIIREPIEPETAVSALEPESDREARAVGEEALRAGRVAVLVLNGGMATRFGGVVKGTVSVFEGHSFIALKAEDVRRASERFGTEISLVLMNSFATDEPTKAHLEAYDWFGLDPQSVLTFTQSICVRLAPDGDVFLGPNGEPSYYAPGHGDFFPSLRRSRAFERLREAGVEVLTFSNVDNLGATLDPVVVGRHLLAEVEISVEVTERRRTASGAWDRGGAPARVAGRSVLVEGFRVPPELPPNHLPDFSTNNMVFSMSALERTFSLPVHAVEKTVHDQTAIQFESLAGEATLADDPQGEPLFDVQFMRVPREGAFGRFFPVKEPVDLDAMRDLLRERLRAGWDRRDR